MKHYPAKLLLFGEHILLVGAPALAIPVPAFSGQWAWSEQPEQRDLWAFSDYLKTHTPFGSDFDEALRQGLYFESNIPEGYGLGSSGALCAAVYDRFASVKTADLTELKAVFAEMESFFHGNSSGIDPLTSYIGTPLLIEEKTQVSQVAPKAWTEAPVVFLIDSQLPRQTGPLVQWFLAQYGLPAFRDRLEETLFPAHHRMLDAWLAADQATFWPALQQVSAFQFKHLPPMIPKTLRDFWLKSLAQDEFMLKICGAGGGGFVLGFARNEAVVAHLGDKYGRCLVVG